MLFRCPSEVGASGLLINIIKMIFIRIMNTIDATKITNTILIMNTIKSHPT